MNLLSHLDSFKNDQKIISYDQSTNDIINAILKQHNKSLNDYDKLYCYFDGGNCIDTAKKVFKYLKENVKYVIEPDNLQTVKTPSAILATGKTTGSDCKNFSLFFAGILDAYRRNTGEKFDIAYRFASYDGTNIPEHVFVVINPDTENEIWCDAVLNYFNEKKHPNYFKDKKIKNMALMALSGINEQSQPQMNGLFDFLKKGTDKINTLNEKTSGVLNVLQTGASVVPVFGASISSLIGLVSGLFKGHSEDHFADKAITDKDYDKFMGIMFKWWKERGFDPSKNVHAGVWLKQGPPPVSSWVPQPYQSLKRIEWLPLVWEQTKNTDLAFVINDAIKFGILDKKYFINSKNEMKPEPTAISNIFGGGEGKAGGVSIPLIVGGAALVAFLIFKKKS
jgi:hypothetical protein